MPDTTEYFNDPEREEQLILAENEIYKKIVPQLQEQLQSMANPLREAEEIKAQATLIKAQGDQSIQVAKLSEDQRQFNMTTEQKQDQFMKDLAMQLTTLESKVGTQLDSEVVSNILVFDPETGDFAGQNQ